MSIALMTFDIFGTVLDWRAGLERELGELDFDAVVDRQAELESEQFRSYTEIVAQSLVDEIGLFLNPVVIGAGNAALPADVRLDLALVDEHRFSNGVVYLEYRVEK